MCLRINGRLGIYLLQSVKIVEFFSHSLGTVTQMNIHFTSYGNLLSLGTYTRSMKFGGTVTYCRKSQNRNRISV